MEWSDTADDDGCAANAPPHRDHELGKIIGECRRRTIRSCVVDAKGDDNEVGRLWWDARQQLLAGILDGRPGKPLRAPCDRTTGQARQRPCRCRGDRLVAAREPEAAYGRFANGSSRIGFPMPGTNPWWGGLAGGRQGTRRRVAAPWAITSGNSTNEPKRRAAIAARDAMAWRNAAWRSCPFPMSHAVVSIAVIA